MHISKFNIGSSSEIEQILKIYRKSFPENERHSDESIVQRIKSGRESCYLLNFEEKIAGIALIWDLCIDNFLVLDYFAIDSDFRQKGVGTDFLSRLFDIYNNQNSILILEIEKPDFSQPESPEVRRYNFYKKLKCRLIDEFAYTMPSINGKEPVNMNLLLSPGFSDNSISGAELKSLICEMYNQMYYCELNSDFVQSELKSINNEFYQID